MTEAPKNRTGSTDDQQKVSLTVGSLDRDLRLGFKNWLPRFQAAVDDAPRTADAWEALSEKCNEQDLEWAFYWAVVRIKMELYAPEAFKDFQRKSHKLLRGILRLRPTLKEVMACKFDGTPVWTQYFAFLGLSRREAVRFWIFQAYFDLFAEKLALSVGEEKASESSGSVSAYTGEKLGLSVRIVKKSGSKSKPPVEPPSELLHFNTEDCRFAVPGELLYLYIIDCTRRPHYRQVSVLLELAAKAYDLYAVFTQDAVEQRHKRFSRDHPQKVKEIKDDISEMWKKRIEDNERVDLIPFLFAREKVRTQPIIDYVKALRSKLL